MKRLRKTNTILVSRSWKLSAKLKPMNLPVRVHLFVIPLNSKASLVKQLDGELKRLQ